MRKPAVFFPLLVLGGWMSALRDGTCAEAAYYAPPIPPKSRYVIDATVDIDRGVLTGRETISLNNTGRSRIEVVAFDWDRDLLSTIEVSMGGRRLYPAPDEAGAPQRKPLYVRLPGALEPGSVATLDVTFRKSGPVPREQTAISTSNWYPRLWWDDLDHHDAFSVRLDVPAGWTLGASGRLDPNTGRYEAASAASFGIYLAKGMRTVQRDVDGILVTAISTDKGAKAAAVCLETAADAVRFYRNWLGFYPFPFLTIIPGGPGRWGGYPVATGIVAIHGLETYVDGESPQHWQYITSHEIGHQYWGEWVLDPDNPAWLWIAMGIFADTEFMMTRGFDAARRARWMGNYVNSIPMYYDTTLDIPPAQLQQIRFDHNNTVIHSKGPAAIFALDSVLGRDLFLRIYRKCLQEHGGRRLGWREFQSVCEAESGLNLQWFFDSWVRSNQYLCYSVDPPEIRTEAGGFTTEVRVKRLGTMAMPIPLKVTFENGTEQKAITDRNRETTKLIFHSSAKLGDVVLDPDGRFAMVKHPVVKIGAAAAARLAYGWNAGDAAEVYEVVKKERISSAPLWFQLGLDLYESDKLDGALDCFSRVDSLEADRLTKFSARAARGALADLLGNRAAALAHYTEALAIDPGEAVTYSRLRLKIDRDWLQTRLQKPFTRESAISLSARPTASELMDVVNRLNYTHEGSNPELVFEKTRDAEIKDASFWFKLGLVLFDSGYYRDSLTSFETVTSLERSGVRAFAAMVWQGHLNDLSGDRGRALERYREALKLDSGRSMQHSQYRMVIDREWIESRLETPFSWKKP
jgi:tetratricopeptide (TPR) repeat protein